MKKVLFVINSLDCGGAEKSLLSLLSLIDYSKYNVSLQMFRRGGMFAALLPEQVVINPELDYVSFCKMSFLRQLVSFDARKIFARIRTRYLLKMNARNGQPLHDAQAYWKYARQGFSMLKDTYDVAIAWGQGSPTHFVAEKVQATKKFAWINADYASVGHNKDFDAPFYEKFDKIVCVSDQLQSLFAKVFPQYQEKLTVIFDINNPETIQVMSEAICALPKDDGFTLVTVGRLVPQKGYDIAAEAAMRLKQRGLRFHWYIIGGGNSAPIEADIEKYQISDCFTLLGAKANPYPYMKAADIYVQTSRSEGYCLTLTEARILNIPCVTTKFDVVFAQMVDGKNGLVVEMNARAVADGIMRLAEDSALYAHIKEYQANEKKGNVEEIQRFYSLLEQSNDKVE